MIVVMVTTPLPVKFEPIPYHGTNQIPGFQRAKPTIINRAHTVTDTLGPVDTVTISEAVSSLGSSSWCSSMLSTTI